jgi:uncharacterized surface protein with fasciclin (FAS1) repeats
LIKKKKKSELYLFLLSLLHWVARMAQVSNALGLLVLGLALIEPSKAFQPSNSLDFFTGESVFAAEPSDSFSPSLYLDALFGGGSEPSDLILGPGDHMASVSGNLDELINSELMDLPPPTPPPTSDTSSLIEKWSFGSITEDPLRMRPAINSAVVEEQEQSQSCTDTDLSQYLRAAGDLSTFAAIWNERRLSEKLIPDGLKYTILAPTDAAFQELFAASGDMDESSLMASPVIDLLLLHHVIPQRVSSVSELASLGRIQTATCDRVELADGPTIDETATMRPLVTFSSNSNNSSSKCAITRIEESELKACGIDLYSVSCLFSPPLVETWADPLCLPVQQQGIQQG